MINRTDSKLRILHLEDLASDAELVERELRKGEIKFEKILVDNKEEFQEALQEFLPDIILSDHSLPSFNSIEALKLLKEAGLKIPFILITATISEEFAVEVMKQGAYDYILKDRLQRLPSAVLNAIERNLAEKDKQTFLDDLIQRNKDLEQFAYIVSHNLRAPVANILGLSEIMQRKKLSGEDKFETMRGLSSSVKKLDDVIKDLNHILQVRFKVSEQKELILFSQLASDIHQSIKGHIEKEEAEFKWDFSEVDEFLTIKSYLHSIFYNLISNSLKYRQPDIPPIIEIRSRQVKDKIEVLFKDNGMGIDLKKKSAQVFGLYKRFHTHSAEGKGVGLYMVKTQVEILGGRISIESEINKGTTFKIEFAI